MPQFSSVEISNWISLYLAAALCCAIVMALSSCVTIRGLYRDRIWNNATSLRPALLLLPKICWRWQKLYLLSTPLTLGIVAWFASTLRRS